MEKKSTDEEIHKLSEQDLGSFISLCTGGRVKVPVVNSDSTYEVQKQNDSIINH